MRHNDTTISLRLPVDLVRRINDCAIRDDRPRSAYLRRLISRALNAEQGGQGAEG